MIQTTIIDFFGYDLAILLFIFIAVNLMVWSIWFWLNVFENSKL